MTKCEIDVGEVVEKIDDIAYEIRSSYLNSGGRMPTRKIKKLRDYLNNVLQKHCREAEKDAEIAELRECLQLAVEMKCANCGLCTRGIEPCYPEGQIVHHEDCFMIMKWRKALEGGQK